MTSRNELARILRQEVLDTHGVAETLGIPRSSVHTLIARRRTTEFPMPVYETSGDKRHPVRLWARRDIEIWAKNRR